MTENKSLQYINCIIFRKENFNMSYEKPQVKKIEADVSVRNMADDQGECTSHPYHADPGLSG